jgi:DNA polymerase-3 subunit gamma/tau
VEDWLASASFKPEPHVTCVTATKVCSDKKGPSITLTQVYFGRAAAQDLADQLGPGAPGYMRAPEPAPNAAQQAPQQQIAPVATVEPLPGPEQGVPLPVTESVGGDAPISSDAATMQEPAQPEPPLASQEPAIAEPAPLPELTPEPVIAEPAPMPEPQSAPEPEPAPVAEGAPAQPAPAANEGGCSDPQGCAAQ